MRILPFGLVLGSLAAVTGCRTVAPIHVWSPPEITSAVGKKVAIAPLAGPQPIADQIESQVFRSVPREQALAVDAIAVDALRSQQPVRLASTGGNMPSDLALLPVARHQGIDYLLMGEVLRDRLAHHSRSVDAELPGSDDERTEESGGNVAAGSEKESSLPNHDRDRVSVAWRVYDVAEARPLADRVMVSDSAPFAAIPASDQRLVDGNAISPVQASGRQVWRLLSPSVQRTQVNLAVPAILPGSKAVRRGNELARNGHWPEAEQLWRQTLDQYPYQHAARNNLALAAAARQDFSTAKRLIRKAIRARSKSLYQENLAWIEIRQRDYHAAFGLPDPPEGWFITASSPQTP